MTNVRLIISFIQCELNSSFFSFLLKNKFDLSELYANYIPYYTNIEVWQYFVVFVTQLSAVLLEAIAHCVYLYSDLETYINSSCDIFSRKVPCAMLYIATLEVFFS